MFAIRTPDKCKSLQVMKDGAVQETGTAAEILGNPQSPYTQSLIAAILGQDWMQAREAAALGA